MTENSPLSIGVNRIDEQLDGGIPRGGITQFSGASYTDAELFLFQVVSLYETHYITNVRSENVIYDMYRKTIGTTQKRREHIAENVKVSETGMINVVSGINDAMRVSNDFDLTVIDTINVIESQAKAEQYQDFLNNMYRHANTEDTAMLFFRLNDAQTDGMNGAITNHFSDLIVNIKTTNTDQGTETQLRVTKARGQDKSTEPVNVSLGEEVDIDSEYTVA